MRSIVTKLTSASRCQDHTTSPSAKAPFVFQHLCVHRISPNVRDDGQRPSFGRDARSCRSDLPDGLSEIFLTRGLDSALENLPVGQISDAPRIVFRQTDRPRAVRRRNCPTSSRSGAFLCFGEGLFQIGDDVVDMFDTDRQPHIAFCDAGPELFFFRQLRVGRCGRMDSQ